MNLQNVVHRKSFSVKKLFSAVSVFLCSFLLFAEVEVTTITINNARQTTYTKSDEGNDVIVLEGSVDLSVSKGETVSQIKADKITYDRKSEMLYAESNVEITTKSSSSGVETTTASSLLMNTSTLEGIFDNGRVVQTQTDAINLPAGSTLIVFADIFGKGKSNTIAFKNSSLTFCDAENPHWHIDATRTWLLPGGEFAFFNALLYVGYVPVLYFPAFYYPKDELVFNPVFGTRKREGYFINNTIYLFGRKPLDSSSASSSESSDSTSAESLKAIYNFMKPSSLKEQKLEGLVLHNLEEDYKGDTTNYVKLMADSYSNLGYMVGLNGNLSPAPKYISKLSFNAYIGMSNTIFTNFSDEYVNYSPEGNTYSDNSSFMGWNLPFRYAGDLEFALSKPFSIKFSLPIYSDPFFSYDFLENRSETMDWISYFLDSTSESDDEVSINEISSFSWSASTSISPTIPSVLKPYISSFSFSSNSSVLVSSMNSVFSTVNSSTKEVVYYYDTDKYESEWTKNTPTRKFYYPSQVIPLSANASISGTIFQWPLASSTKAANNKKTPEYAITLNKPEELKSENELIQQEVIEETESNKNDISEETEEMVYSEYDSGEEDEIEIDFVKPVLPELSFTPETSTVAAGINYKLTYSVAPSLSTSINYASSNNTQIVRDIENASPLLTSGEDFDWSNIRSYMYTIKIPTTITSALSFGGSFLSLTNKLAYSPVWQKHPYIQMGDVDDPLTYGGYDETAANALILADYKADSQTVSTSNTLSFMPFTSTVHFADTGLNWNSTVKIFRREFVGDADNPEWETYSIDLENDDCVTVNTLDFTLGASELSNKFKQTLTFTTVLPPLLKTYSATLKLVFPYVTGTVSCSYEETTHDDVDIEEKWKINPIQQSLSLSLFGSKLKITESFNYNVEDDIHHPESFKLSATWNSLQLAYVMSYTYGYELDTETGWMVKSEKEFLPYSLSFSYSPGSKTFYKWFNRISIAPGLSTSIVADLLRPTNTYFLFNPSLTFKINEFFNITFSSSSKNSILYWYFKEGLYDDWGGFPGNVLCDLLNSFRFDDESKRKSSGFKLKSLDMTMSHELHDWDFNLTFKVEPELVTKSTGKTYDFTPYITIGVVWKPMESIKSKLVYDYDKDAEEGIWALE